MAEMERAHSMLCDKRIPVRTKDKTYEVAGRDNTLYDTECLLLTKMK